MSNNKFGLRTRLGLIKEISQTTQSDSSCGWERPAEWLDLPVNTDVNKRVFYGLFLVFENEYNALRVTFGGTPTVDWGDGNTGTLPTTTTHVYDYSAITSTVNQYYDGRNYKQVIITIENFGTAAARLDDRGGVINNYSSLNFADIYMSYGNGSANISYQINSLRTLPYLEIFKFENAVYQGGLIIKYASRLQIVEFNNVSKLRYLNLQYSTIHQNIVVPNLLTSTTHYRNLIIDELSINLTPGGATPNPDAIFRYIRAKKIMFTSSLVGSFEGRNFARDSYTLEEAEIGPCIFTRYDYGFNNCVSLRKVTFQDFSTVTNTLNMFSGTGNIRELIVRGCTVGIDISSNSMTADALDAMFTSLGTANGAQTITITDNPGTATCDTTIATGKGYTVVV